MRPKSWTRHRYTPSEMRRVNTLFDQGGSATDEQREAYIREQTAEVQREWERQELANRTAQQFPAMEMPRWKI